MQRPVGVVTSAEAADAVGVSPSTFRVWARDRGLRALGHVRLGRSTVALWDLDAVYEAEAGGDTPTRPVEADGSRRDALR